MIRKFLFAISILALTACGGESNPEVLNEDVDVVVTEPEMTVYGDSTVTANGALEPKDFLAQMDGKDSLKVKLRATIKETCQKKGCWMTLDMENGEEMRVRFKDYGFFVPKEGVNGKKVIIDGYAFPDTISVADLRHLAEDGGKSESEIAAINEPEVGVNFEATGVIIEN
ncbi:DUF4920 domain-containing protein [Cryomorpha ignava]|uniref:DUF4920 domain-containing protein n=1 Tax=Cryomorpha ignava TaxID=101383 RepID=A0A7K3WSQ7_9FLAO|nr:DUF4920 domain-containing protein [Cryomorpha ignava]NEN24730.1 DUF4920 domain-containing protein [Cryomorpha ignava]